MDLLENALVRYALIAVVALLAPAFLYLICIGVRALFREVRDKARRAGHGASAGARAIAYMLAWSALFVVFYLLTFYFGKALGWWAVPPVAVAFVLMIGGLLLADELLTLAPENRRRIVLIGGTLASLVAVFAAAIWIAV